MIRFDCTRLSVVVSCACGAREVVTTRAAADRWALAHVNIAHPAPTPDQERFFAAARQRRRRARLAG